MKFFIKTFGCKLNQADSSLWRDFLLSSGWEESEDADLFIVNSCCVTALAEKKVFKAACAFKKSGKEVVVTGCITDSLRRSLERKKIECKKTPQSMGIRGYIPPRAFLKIQNGCNRFCSFCVVPYLRGAARNVPFSEVISQVRGISQDKSFKEIVITGTNISDYRFEKGGLIELLEAISKETSSRLRLTSLGIPVSDEFVEKLSKIKGICPHFHLSLQSGSDKILKRMFRFYSVEDFRKSVLKLRRFFPNCAITTDVIYGFPGEEEDDFQKTLEVIKELNFARTHIFPFSKRPGILAQFFKGIPSHIFKERKKRLKEAASASAAAYRNSFIGRVVEVISEKKEDGFFYGTSEYYQKVKFSNGALFELSRVQVKYQEGEFLVGG